MRVTTYNVHDCVGRDGVYDPARIAGIVSDLDADVVALQEVTLDYAGDVLATLERITGMKAIDGTLFNRGVGRYGNLLLSRLPVIEQCLHDISWAGREPRSVIDTRVRVGRHVCRVLATHLGLRWRERREQISRLARLVGDHYGPTVLLGDFNVLMGDVAFRPLRNAGLHATIVRSFPTWFVPVLALDRILIREPISFIRHWRHGETPALMASDHFPLVADLRLHRDERTKTIPSYDFELIRTVSPGDWRHS